MKLKHLIILLFLLASPLSAQTFDADTPEQKPRVKTTVLSKTGELQITPNATIQGWLNYYLGRGRTVMERGLRRSGKFIPMAREIFEEENVPSDVVWLGQVESAWLPNARSWAAAVGLWQFIPSTGSRFGLRQDLFVDERSSFEKATRASAKYLKFLADRYEGDWELAMAAYNSGEGNVDRAIARSGYADFWEIYEKNLLPAETKSYVPTILATIMIAKNPKKYGFDVTREDALAFDIVRLNHSVDLQLAADACDIASKSLAELNPELKQEITPSGYLYGLRVPVGCGKSLESWLQRIPVNKRTSWRILSAREDDTFAAIAQRTGATESALSAVNGGLVPDAGEKVIVPLDQNIRTVASVASKGSMVAKVAEFKTSTVKTANPKSESVSSLKTSKPKIEAKPIVQKAKSKNAPTSPKLVSYTVKRNESLTAIADRHKMALKDLVALNQLKMTTRVQAGQSIKIMK